MTQRRQQIEKMMEDLGVMKRQMMAGAPCHAKEGHVTPSQWLVLQYLRKQKTATMKEVAGALSMTSSAATQLVESLVQKGYVSKETNNEDKRALSLSLSSKSKKHIEAFRKKRIEAIEQVFGVLSDREFTTYCQLLGKITKGLVTKK